MSSYAKKENEGPLYEVVTDALEGLYGLYTEVRRTRNILEDKFPDTYLQISRYSVTKNSSDKILAGLQLAGYIRGKEGVTPVLRRIVVHGEPKATAPYLPVQYDTRRQTKRREVSQIVRLGNVIDALDGAATAVVNNRKLWEGTYATVINKQLTAVSDTVREVDFPQYWG